MSENNPLNIVITGGASGVGNALVNRLQTHNVWILDVKSPDSVATKHKFVNVNLADKASIDKAMAQLPPKIDRLANVAGIATAPDPETVLAVNFLGLRMVTETLAQRFSEGARVVSVSSVAGRDWSKRFEKLVPLLETNSFESGLEWCQTNSEQLARDPYTFSKRMVTAYTLQHSEQALKQGYRINCISPGPIETPLYPTFEGLMGKAQSEWMAEQTGRVANPNDIAEVIDTLIMVDCDWLNGVDIPVDGGYTAGIESGWIDFRSSPVMQGR